MHKLVRLPLAYRTPSWPSNSMANLEDNLEKTTQVIELLILRTIGLQSEQPFKVPRVHYHHHPYTATGEDLDLIMYSDADEFAAYFAEEVSHPDSGEFPWSYGELSFGDVSETLVRELKRYIGVTLSGDGDLVLFISLFPQTTSIVVNIEVISAT